MTKKRPADKPDLSGYEVLVGVAGGIAAYKVCTIVSALVQQQVAVTVAMTRSARRFVGPLTFQALSGRSVLTSLWTSSEPTDVEHIRLTQRVDLFLLAPATANLIGKLAAGLADELLTTLVLSADSPVLLAPAMNVRMYENPIVRDNLARLEQAGYTIIPPESGWLACRSVGMGRMADPDTIVSTMVSRLREHPPKRDVASAE